MLWLKNLRDIVILPFTVTCIIPLLIYNPAENLIPENPLIKATGLVFAAGGLSLFVYTVFLFNRFGKGTLAPWSPKVRLVVSGPYRYCRNPMITGVCFILLAESLIFHSTSILKWYFAVFLINTFYFLLVEEPALSRKFGHEYEVYKNNVPRWIPRITPFRSKDEVSP